jgi:hypothetical protein
MNKNPHAVALGRLGAKARMKKMSPEELSAQGRKGGLASGRARRRLARAKKAS